MSFGMIVWSLMCMGAGFALYPYMQRFAWYRKMAARIKDWSDGKR